MDPLSRFWFPLCDCAIAHLHTEKHAALVSFRGNDEEPTDKYCPFPSPFLQTTKVIDAGVPIFFEIFKSVLTGGRSDP